MPLPCTSTCFWAEGLAEGLAGLLSTRMLHIYFSFSCGGSSATHLSKREPKSGHSLSMPTRDKDRQGRLDPFEPSDTLFFVLNQRHFSVL